MDTPKAHEKVQKLDQVEDEVHADACAKFQDHATSESQDIVSSNSGPNADVLSHEDDSYNEDEDEDYILESNSNGKDGVADIKEPCHDAYDYNEADRDNEDEYINEEDKKEIAKYSYIESSEGGLIKTRTQRLLEEQKEKQKQKTVVKESSGTSDADINSIWAELKGSAAGKSKRLSTPTSSSPSLSSASPSLSTSSNILPEKIKITRSYEFAGKTVTEEKLVDANSQEAKAHLNSTTIKQSDNKETPPFLSQSGSPSSAHPNLRRKRKRASLLDAVISNSSAAKLSTLEKSRLDWATYVDKNKINDELKYKNKAGYLEKQDFLNRVDSRRDNLYKDAKAKTLKDC
jgi:hypothetical protein